MAEQRRCPTCNGWYDPGDERSNRPRRFCSRGCASVRGNTVRWHPPPRFDRVRLGPRFFMQHLLPF